MITEKERSSREKLFQLMKEYPDLPVIPMVDADIVADDCGYWVGSWGSVDIDEYLVTERSERILFKSNDDVFDVLECCLSIEEFEALPESENDCRTYYDQLPWVKGIIVYINLPE